MVWAGFAVTSGSAAAAAEEEEQEEEEEEVAAALMGHAYRHLIASEEAMLAGRSGSAYANIRDGRKAHSPLPGDSPVTPAPPFSGSGGTLRRLAERG